MSDGIIEAGKRIFILVFLIAFVGVWGYVCVRFMQWDPPETAKGAAKIMVLSETQVAMAGALATTLGGAIGAMLGVKVPATNGASTLGLGKRVGLLLRRFGQALLSLTVIGGLALAIYALFALMVGALAFTRSDEAPQLLLSFGLSVLAFIGAAFTATLSTKPA